MRCVSVARHPSVAPNTLPSKYAFTGRDTFLTSKRLAEQNMALQDRLGTYNFVTTDYEIREDTGHKHGWLAY